MWDGFAIQKNKQKSTQKTLLIVRLDAIGDYILFRNFLAAIRSSEKFRHHQIILCGNELWKPIAEEFDAAYVDAFIWIDKRRFVQELDYRKCILNQVNQLSAEVVFCAHNSRELITTDSIVRASKANQRIGSASNTSVDNSLFLWFGSRFYTQLLNTHEIFEFDRNKELVEELTKESVAIHMPTFDLHPVKRQQQILFFPGAGEPKRKWDTAHFSQLADLLWEHYSYPILIGGSEADKKLAQEIISGCKKASPKDLTGQTSLVASIRLMHESSLVVSNETGTLHMAIASETPTIGLLTGKHFKRFAPYPNAAKTYCFIYPQPQSVYETLYVKHGPDYFEDVISDMQAILPEYVFAHCKKVLQ
jgi:ADP-heptose:LPS heptosyltransferase